MTLPLRIRRLDRAEAALLREIRIAALTDSPREFGESIAEALARSERDWSELASSAHVAEIDGRWVGLAFAFADGSDPASARVGGMWVAPGARRSGVAAQLLKAVLAWASAEGKRRVRLWVSPESPAEALYRRATFVATGAQKRFPGDAERALLEMQLVLEGSD
jgi:GNAT superfamily N-acetyltransferase